MQGPTAYLSSVTRELSLILDQLLHSHNAYYELSMDHGIFAGALSIKLKKDRGNGGDSKGSGGGEGDANGEGGGGGDDGGGDGEGSEEEDEECGDGEGSEEDKECVTIRALPWENAPKADGSMVEFREQLALCQKKMDHFANHTPYYFLAHQKTIKVVGQKEKTGGKQQLGGLKAVGQGKGRGQKRKACDEDDDNGKFE